MTVDDAAETNPIPPINFETNRLLNHALAIDEDRKTRNEPALGTEASGEMVRHGIEILGRGEVLSPIEFRTMLGEFSRTLPRGSTEAGSAKEAEHALSFLANEPPLAYMAEELREGSDVLKQHIEREDLGDDQKAEAAATIDDMVDWLTAENRPMCQVIRENAAREARGERPLDTEAAAQMIIDSLIDHYLSRGLTITPQEIHDSVLPALTDIHGDQEQRFDIDARTVMRFAKKSDGITKELGGDTFRQGMAYLEAQVPTRANLSPERQQRAIATIREITEKIAPSPPPGEMTEKPATEDLV
jgi:hypothetical protein